MDYITLPVELPFTLGSSGTVTLPLTLPFVFDSGGKGTVTLPLTLPFSFMAKGRNTIKLPIKETCEYLDERKLYKLPIREAASTNLVKLPVKEYSWMFYGLILEENLIETMRKPLVLMEDVKARILFDMGLKNGTDVNIHWYGDEVPAVEIYKKLLTDEEYELVSTHKWTDDNADMVLGNGEFDIMLKGVNGTGESIPSSLGETSYIEVDVNVQLPVNEKIYSFDIEYTSVYRIDINY